MAPVAEVVLTMARNSSSEVRHSSAYARPSSAFTHRETIPAELFVLAGMLLVLVVGHIIAMGDCETSAAIFAAVVATAFGLLLMQP